MKIIYHQAAVIPFRLMNNKFKILLVTSRSNQQWTIPKGIIDPGMTAMQTAIQEAYEEAGITGILYDNPMLEFSYRKWQGSCQVKTYFFRVEQELEYWPEKSIRQRRWVSLPEAKRLIKFPEVCGFLEQITALNPAIDPITSQQPKK